MYVPPSAVDIHLLPWLTKYTPLDQLDTLYGYQNTVSAITHLPKMFRPSDRPWEYQIELVTRELLFYRVCILNKYVL